MENLNILLILLIILPNDAVGSDSFLSKFQQHEYKIKNTRIEMKSYDKDYVNLMTIATFKYNRTTAAINATWNFNVTVEDKLQVVVQGYKFLSNEYRILHSIRFQVNLCKAMNSNIIGSRSVFNCGNFSQCYIVKDVTYHFCNFVADETRFPPHVPNGEYKAEIEVMYLHHVICTINFYTEIYRPIYPK